MRVSEAILKLQEVLDGHGDMEVVGLAEANGEFIVDFGKTFDIIEVPNDDETDFHTVCAMMDDIMGGRTDPRGNLRLIQ